MSTVALNLAMLARPQREGSSASRGRGCDRGREVAKKRRIIRAPAAAAWGLRRRPLLPVIGHDPAVAIENDEFEQTKRAQRWRRLVGW